MGFRPTGLSSLTGYVDNSRQSDPSAPVRYLQPPSETVSFRHPDYAQGRDSLTSSVGSLSSARVEGSYSATPSNLTNKLESTTREALEHEICMYKTTCIKQANAAHHQITLSTMIDRQMPPKGIFSPILKKVNDTLDVPFIKSPDFQKEIYDITNAYCLHITEVMKRHWEVTHT